MYTTLVRASMLTQADNHSARRQRESGETYISLVSESDQISEVQVQSEKPSL